MSRVDLIAQLIVLNMAHINRGESYEELASHFQAELDRGEIVWVEEDGKVVAYCDFDWVLIEGEPLLHVINLVCTRPGLIWKIRSLLPKSKWITGMRGTEFHAPKGIPKEVAA